ncbi:MAG: type I DNA topoisomerase [Candidatus Zixiibacteriota bacterium]
MDSNLVIVESPAKTKALKKFLGEEFEVEASVGHLKDLPQRKLGVEIENDFAPDYEIIKGKKKILDKLKSRSRKAKAVYLAPDPDREGEAIAWHIAQEIEKINPRIFRASFNEITKEAVLEGIKKAGQIDMNRVNAQQARRVLDRLVGYKVSPLLWKTVFKGLSAGRVQSVALRIICERDEQIEGFVPKEYWSITALLETDKKESFSARLEKIDNGDFEIATEKEAEEVRADIADQEFVVAEVKREKKKRNPYPPYITSSLQQDAARRLSFSPKKTMGIAQELYEGVELGDSGSAGLITYMRTDSFRVAEVARKAASELIGKTYGKEYLPLKPRHYKSRKAAQEAHEAIRPTYVDNLPEKIKGYLTKDQYRLYQLIWNRFVASQMSAAIYDSTTVDIEAGKYLFRASASRLLFDGFLRVYQEVKEDNSEEPEENKLPALRERERLDLLELIPKQHFTKPPPRFSEATLIKELEENGIGRPSTYAQIVSTIKQRKYVEAKTRRLFATELGRTVNQILIRSFPDVFEVKFTASMEEELDKIEEGKEKWVKVLKDFYVPFKLNLEKVENDKKSIQKLTQQKTDEVCEKCGSPMIIRWGRNGKFLACSGFPKCKNTKPLPGDENGMLLSDEKCEVCGASMMIKMSRYGKFLSCSKYPECKFTRPFSIGVSCPEEGCDGSLIERRTKRGRIFFGCSSYPKCKFATWDKPVNQPCPECDAKFLVEKSSKAKGEYLKCVKCGHEQVQPLSAEEVNATKLSTDSSCTSS